ncbi:MAG: hypothetical protein K2W96_08355, partial [Gemmataceae bacterium]|nr:hypothetical protein [Gemmataceae bacterium]
MNLAELQRILRDADPAAVLVSPRILERVIRDDLGLPAMAWNLPHSKSYVCDRQMLWRHAEQADLQTEPDQLLPDKVVLLVRPEADQLSNLERPRLLLKFWRRLFHSRVHLAFLQGRPQGPLADAELRDRIRDIGLTEFAEVRQVLESDRYLTPQAGPREAYIEFAAVFLELRYFAPSLLANTFPGIKDFAKVERLLGRDLDPGGLFQASRLKGAPDPDRTSALRADDSLEAYTSLVRHAQQATLDKDRVKSAILRIKASRVAQAALTASTRKEAEADIAQLTADLAPVLGLNEIEKADWTRNLVLLLDKADQGVLPVEARLLDDLQRAWQDHGREIYAIDLVGYATSFGKRPLKRPLPSQKMVRITRHLADAVGRLDEVRLSDADRGNLSRLLKRALNSSVESLHGRFRPILETALQDVGLKPANPVEQVAFDKMVAELLDRITTHGFISFGELRDAISRNQLKLPDLADPEDFFRGDPLLRLDGRLTSLLDGVYRPSEFYVRWLERGTSLLFGTMLGRCLSRFILLPLLVAWMALHLAGLVLENAAPHGTSEASDFAASALLGPTYQAGDHAPHWGWHAGALAGAALLVLLLIEHRGFRRQVVRGLVTSWKLLRWLAWDLPLRVFPLDSFQQVLNSWLFQIVFWYAFVPGLVLGLFLWLRPDLFVEWWPLVVVYLVATYLVNSRWARSGGEAVRDVFGELGTLVKAGLLPGMVRLVADVFRHTSEAIEAALYHIDEWLRFRDDESAGAVAIRAVLNVVWFPVSFLLRFFFVVLFEPMVNPLKIPLSFLAGKVLIPVYIAANVQGMLAGPLSAVIGAWPANFLVGWVLFLSPNVFGFLGWEMQENWRLYRANRARNLEPLAVGSHGETIRGLLQPGFHSGTVPIAFARLRVAERQAMASRNWNKVRVYRHEVEHLQEALARFADRELTALLRQSRAWKDVKLETGHAYLATNRVRFEIRHPGRLGEAVQVEIQHHHGWLVAGLRTVGWLSSLGEEQLSVFVACLAGFYKRAGVDLVREQVLHTLPDCPELEFTTDAL